MRLILLRHGIAEDPRPDLDDAQRQLTPEGIERTRLAVQGLVVYLGQIDAILSSPKSRAYQTAEVLAQLIDTPIEICPPLAEGTVNQVLSVIKSRSEETLVLVGHEPQLSMIAGRLCGIAAASCIELKKAGALVMRLSQSDPDCPSAVLEALLPPKTLRGLVGQG